LCLYVFCHCSSPFNPPSIRLSSLSKPHFFTHKTKISKKYAARTALARNTVARNAYDCIILAFIGTNLAAKTTKRTSTLRLNPCGMGLWANQSETTRKCKIHASLNLQ
jgi:hypothetical protein